MYLEEYPTIPSWEEMKEELKKSVPLLENISPVWICPERDGINTSVGYKLHIPFHPSDNPTVFANIIIESYNLGVHFKIIKNPVFIDEYGRGQEGKHLVLYPKDLTFLSLLSEECKELLFENKNLIVTNETQIGSTRIFTRFCHFNDAEFFDLDVMSYRYAERGEHLPSFANLPPQDYIFKRINFESSDGFLLSLKLEELYKLYSTNHSLISEDNFFKEEFILTFSNLWNNVKSNKTYVCFINYEILCKCKETLEMLKLI